MKIKNKKIDKTLLLVISVVGIIVYGIIFFTGLNNMLSKRSIEREKTIEFEKERLQNIFSTTDAYKNYVKLRLQSEIFLTKAEQYIQVQKILRELSLLTYKGKPKIQIYDQKNYKLFDGVGTDNFQLLPDEEFKTVLLTKENKGVIETSRELVVFNRVDSPEDYLVLLTIPKNEILVKNDKYSIVLEKNLENSETGESFFKYLKKEFKIKFNNDLKKDILFIFIWLIFPMIIVVFSAYLLYTGISYLFSKHLNLLLKKVQGDKNIETKLGEKTYLEDLYQEIIKKNEFILERTKEIEQIFNERVTGDYLLGTLSYEEIKSRKIYNENLYCGILEIDETIKNFEDYYFYIQKLISNLKKEGVKGIVLEKEHIFLLSDNPFFIDNLKVILNEYIEENQLEIFGVVSLEKVSLEELPERKKEIEKLLIYKDRMKEELILDVESIKKIGISYSYYYPINTEQKVISKIQKFDRKSLENIFKDIFNTNFKELSLSEDSIKRLKRIIVNSIEKISIHFGLKESFADNEYFIKSDLLSDSEFEEKTFLALNKIYEEYRELRSTHDDLASKMKKYIESNYNKEVSLQDFAEYMNFTPQYLSNVYKKVFGENFNISINCVLQVNFLKSCNLNF